MTAKCLHDGTEIAHQIRKSSGNDGDSLRTIITLADLLRALEVNPPSTLKMIRTTCAHLAKFFRKAPHQITIDSVSELKDGFRPFLEQNRYKENSVRTYVNYVRILISLASDRGWRPGDGISEEWYAITKQGSRKHCGVLVRHMARLGKTPDQITTEDVDSWIKSKVQQGGSLLYLKEKRSAFWHLIRDCGYLAEGTRAPLHLARYGIPVEQLPSPLRNEVSEILRWKGAEHVPDRPKDGRHREASLQALRRLFGMLCGYVINTLGRSDISSLCEVITKPIVNSYIDWSINERGVKGKSVYSHLASVLTAVEQHPAYKSLDLSWVKPVLDTITVEPYSEVRMRKEAKYLDYSVLESIPTKILALRETIRKHDADNVSKLAMDELMMRFLLVLAWRQRNVRQCRIAGPNPNLFKGRIDASSLIDKPKWILQAEAQNPNAEFWQFRFSYSETKTGVFVHSFLPKPLIPALEKYLNEFRGNLIGPVKALTLFVNNEGKPLSQNEVTQKVSELTLRHGGRVVTPHLFRDVVAFAWLKAHAADYLTLSKLLWHKNISTTIFYYGGRYNESSATSAMESWLEERQAKST